MKNNNSKALSRIKRIYKSGEWYVVNVLNKFSNKGTIATTKKVESITEFQDSHSYAKLLKRTGTPFTSKVRQFWAKQKNRKTRHESKKVIDEGILEYKCDTL